MEEEKATTTAKVFANREEGEGWTNPVHFFFVAGTGMTRG
jgi:hypothetical protein